MTRLRMLRLRPLIAVVMVSCLVYQGGCWRKSPVAMQLLTNTATNELLPKLLRDYYAKGVVTREGFVDYVLANCDMAVTNRPIGQYLTQVDRGFFIELPPKLESSMPLVIGYSEAWVSTGKGKYKYRRVMFLYKTQIASLTMLDADFLTILPDARTQPDFYLAARAREIRAVRRSGR
jgi:hypothetical protein